MDSVCPAAEQLVLVLEPSLDLLDRLVQGSNGRVLTVMGTCGVGIDCPQGRMQNVNTHLRWGGTGGGRVDEQMMGRTDEGVAVGVNGMREGGGIDQKGMDGWKGGEEHGG